MSRAGGATLLEKSHTCTHVCAAGSTIVGGCGGHRAQRYPTVADGLLHVPTRARAHARTHTCTHPLHMHWHTHTHIHTRTRTRTHARTHARTHTHTHTPSQTYAPVRCETSDPSRSACLIAPPRLSPGPSPLTAQWQSLDYPNRLPV